MDRLHELLRLNRQIRRQNTIKLLQTDAQRIASANFGDSPAATVVQHLTHQVYSGQMNVQNAYAAAMGSGVAEHQFREAFNDLRDLLS